MKNILLSIIAVTLVLSACNPGGSSTVVTVADVGGSPDGVTVTDTGNIYITDIGSGDVKQVEEDGTVTVIASLDTKLGKDTHPDGITSVTDGTGDILYVTDTGTGAGDGSVVKIDTGTGTVTTFVDSTTLNTPTGIAADNAGNLYVADQGTGEIYKIPVTGGGPGTMVSLTGSASISLDQPHGLTLVNNDDGSITLYTTDQGTDDNNIVQIDISGAGNVTGVTELTADNTGGTDIGTVNDAKFNMPHGISTDKNGAIFVCDENNNRVQVITPSGNVNNIAGSGTAGDTDGDSGIAEFRQPRGLAVDAKGDLLVCDYGNGKVKKIIR